MQTGVKRRTAGAHATKIIDPAFSAATRDGETRGISSMPEGSEKAMEKGPLEVLFNGNANAKILDFLSTFQEWDYSESDIAKNSGVNIRTVQRSVPVLERLGLITRVRIVGRAKMYRLDRSSETGRTADKMAHVLAKALIRKA